MKQSETLDWNPITGDWEHTVQVSFDDIALDNAMRRQSGDKGFILKAEAKQKYEIPTDLLYLECVRDFVSSGGKDKYAEAKMLQTRLPDGTSIRDIITCSAQGVAKQRIFMGGESNGKT